MGPKAFRNAFLAIVFAATPAHPAVADELPPAQVDSSAPANCSVVMRSVCQNRAEILWVGKPNLTREAAEEITQNNNNRLRGDLRSEVVCGEMTVSEWEKLPRSPDDVPSLAGRVEVRYMAPL